VPGNASTNLLVNREAPLEKRFVAQSEIADRDKRRRLVWDIDKQLQEDGARPII
jgi:hypothetical protein